MPLKGTIILSLIFHAALLGFRPPAGWVPPRESLTTLEVTYLAEDPFAVQRQVVQPKAKPAPKLQPVAKAKPAPKAVAKRTPVQKTAPVRKTPPKQVLPMQKATQGASSLPDAVFAEITHKEEVRDHLKQFLKYPAQWLQGTVRVSLELDAKGGLLNARVLEASNQRLSQIAYGDMKAAQPYPVFPKAMDQKHAQYEFLVRYQRD